MQKIPYLVIVNRTKLKRQGKLIDSPLFQHGEVVYTDYPKHATELAAKAVKYPLVIAAGGDGTVHEVANGLLQIETQERPMLGILPIGSGNDLVKVLGGLDPREVPSLSMLARTYPHPTYRIETPNLSMHGVNVADIGLGGVTVEALDRKFRSWGKLAYPAAILRAFFKHKPFECSVSVNGEERNEKLLIAAFGTGSYFGRGLGILPQDDRGLKAAFVGDIGYLTYLKHLKTLRRKEPISHPKVSYQQPTTLSLNLESPVSLEIDGEGYGMHDEFRISLGESLRMVLP